MGTAESNSKMLTLCFRCFSLTVSLVAPKSHTYPHPLRRHCRPVSRLLARLNLTALCDWKCLLLPTSIQGCPSTVVLFQQGGRGREFPFKVPDEPPLTVTSLTGWGRVRSGGGNKEEQEFSGSTLPPQSDTLIGRKLQKDGSRRATMSTLTWYKLFWMFRTSFGNSCINC